MHQSQSHRDLSHSSPSRPVSRRHSHTSPRRFTPPSPTLSLSDHQSIRLRSGPFSPHPSSLSSFLLFSSLLHTLTLQEPPFSNGRPFCFSFSFPSLLPCLILFLLLFDFHGPFWRLFQCLSGAFFVISFCFCLVSSFLTFFRWLLGRFFSCLFCCLLSAFLNVSFVI